MLKLINRYYKIFWLKITGTFKEETRIPLKLTIEKIWCRQKRKTFEQFLQTSVHADMKSTKRGIFQQNTPTPNFGGQPKKWQQPVPNHFDGSEDFFSEFWITVWRSNKEQSNFFRAESTLKGLPLTSKAPSD